MAVILILHVLNVEVGPCDLLRVSLCIPLSLGLGCFIDGDSRASVQPPMAVTPWAKTVTISIFNSATIIHDI